MDRAGADPRELLRAQRGQLTPIARALASHVYATTGFEHTLALWRHESISATLRFLDALLVTAPAQHPKIVHRILREARLFQDLRGWAHHCPQAGAARPVLWLAREVVTSPTP